MTDRPRRHLERFTDTRWRLEYGWLICSGGGEHWNRGWRPMSLKIRPHHLRCGKRDRPRPHGIPLSRCWSQYSRIILTQTRALGSKGDSSFEVAWCLCRKYIHMILFEQSQSVIARDLSDDESFVTYTTTSLLYSPIQCRSFSIIVFINIKLYFD